MSFPGATALRFTFLLGDTESNYDNVTIYTRKVRATAGRPHALLTTTCALLTVIAT